MSRFASFVDNLPTGEIAFVPFVVLGDPTPELSLRLVDTLVDAGADALELGLPFSDPPADGPAIQAASQRALAAGATTARSLDLVAAIRRRHALPISLLGYLNPILQRGLDAFYARAADAGADAVLVADVPLDESAPLVDAAGRHGIDPIFIASERSDAARLARVARVARGYLYAVAHLGVTGERADLPPGLTSALARMRAHVPLPLLAGFGFSTPDQVRAAHRAGADGVVCGSAIARRIEARLADPDALLADVHRFAAAMKQATRPAPLPIRSLPMLIVMDSSASPDAVERVCERIRALGLTPHPIPGAQRTAIGLTGNAGPLDPAPFESLPGVREVVRVSAPYKLVSREVRPDSTVITLANGVQIGGAEPCVIGGPCSVESEDQLMTTAAYVAAAGCRVLRAGAFKPRTSPYDFQGLGLEGLRLLARARTRFGLAIVTEALDPAGADLVAEHADIIQIGARSMTNPVLLRHIGRLRRPVLLKRGPAATIKEWLLAAEYIASAGNDQIILCERGVRGFDEMTRNLLDLSAIPLVQSLSHLPVLADPSHGTGRRSLVIPMARAAIAAGAHGVIVETHPCPERALSDGPQALLPDQFARLVHDVTAVHRALSAA